MDILDYVYIRGTIGYEWAKEKEKERESIMSQNPVKTEPNGVLEVVEDMTEGLSSHITAEESMLKNRGLLDEL